MDQNSHIKRQFYLSTTYPSMHDISDSLLSFTLRASEQQHKHSTEHRCIAMPTCHPLFTPLRHAALSYIIPP